MSGRPSVPSVRLSAHRKGKLQFAAAARGRNGAARRLCRQCPPAVRWLTLTRSGPETQQAGQRWRRRLLLHLVWVPLARALLPAPPRVRPSRQRCGAAVSALRLHPALCPRCSAKRSTRAAASTIQRAPAAPQPARAAAAEMRLTYALQQGDCRAAWVCRASDRGTPTCLRLTWPGWHRSRSPAQCWP